jgi:hypothetical protein
VVIGALRRRRGLRVALVSAAVLAAAGAVGWYGFGRLRTAPPAPFDLARQGEQFWLSFTQELHAKAGPPKRVVVAGLLQSAGPEKPGTNRFVRAFRLIETRVTPAEGAPAADLEKGFAGAVARPFLVFCEQGRPARAAFAPDVSVAARNLLLAVIAELPCEKPDLTAPVVRTERDLFGRYLAQLKPDADGHGFERRKLEYVDLGVPGNDTVKTAAAVTIGNAVWHFRFGKENALESAKGDERLTVETGLAGLAPEIHTQIRLDSKGGFDAEPMLERIAATEQALVPAPIITQKVDGSENARNEDRERVGTATLSELLAPFDRTSAGRPSLSLAEQRVAVERLASFVRLSPSAVPELVSRIRAAPPGSSQELVQALGLVRRPPARAALLELARDARAAPSLRVAAVRVLAQDEPAPETLAALESLFESSERELREAAVYSYGTLLYTWRKREPSAAAPALEKLVERLNAATDGEARVLALQGLGNAADAASVPAIQRALADPAPAVRDAAVQALRNVMAPGVDQAITHTLRHDASPTVRAAAIFAAGFRDVTTYADALADCAQKDPDAVVRSAAVDALARIVATQPRASEALAWVAKNDPKPALRQRAAELLRSPAAR